MKIKDIIIYCNPQAQCPVLEAINQLDIVAQIQFLHKVGNLRLSIYNESIKLDSGISALRFHYKNKEMAIYYGIGRSAIVLLYIGLKNKHEADSKKASIYWKDYQQQRENREYLTFAEELNKKLQDKEFAIEYLKATIVDPEERLFVLALKDVLQSQTIDDSDITEKTELNTTNLSRLLFKKNAIQVIRLPDILVALGLYLAAHPIKKIL